MKEQKPHVTFWYRLSRLIVTIKVWTHKRQFAKDMRDGKYFLLDDPEVPYLLQEHELKIITTQLTNPIKRLSIDVDQTSGLRVINFTKPL